jgi:hypothetical protein
VSRMKEKRTKLILFRPFFGGLNSMYNKCMYNKTYYFKHGCRTNLETNDLEEIKNLDDKSVGTVASNKFWSSRSFFDAIAPL